MHVAPWKSGPFKGRVKRGLMWKSGPSGCVQRGLMWKSGPSGPRLVGLTSALAPEGRRSFPETIVMNILQLGPRKNGIAGRGSSRHPNTRFKVWGRRNTSCATLTAEKLRDIDVVIDFTMPHCVIANIEAWVQACKNMVVERLAGTTNSITFANWSKLTTRDSSTRQISPWE